MGPAVAAIISATGSLGYALPTLVGLESFGIPAPGETALITAAVLASEGKLQIWLVLLIGIGSAIVGDSIGYELGQHFGREVLTASGPLQKERVKAIEGAERFFHKHGDKTVFFGRWITGVRSAVAWLAGIEHMHYLRFLFYNATGAITWGLTYGLVGYYGGRSAADAIKTVGFYALIAVGVGLIVWFAVRWYRKRTHAAQPEDGGGAGGAADPDRPRPSGGPDPDARPRSSEAN